MQQFLHWRVQVLLLCGGHQEQQALGACAESFQGHVINPSGPTASI
jgi:hypothetical protein